MRVRTITYERQGARSVVASENYACRITRRASSQPREYDALHSKSAPKRGGGASKRCDTTDRAAQVVESDTPADLPSEAERVSKGSVALVLTSAKSVGVVLRQRRSAHGSAWKLPAKVERSDLLLDVDSFACVTSPMQVEGKASKR